MFINKIRKQWKVDGGCGGGVGGVAIKMTSRNRTGYHRLRCPDRERRSSTEVRIDLDDRTPVSCTPPTRVPRGTTDVCRRARRSCDPRVRSAAGNESATDR